MVEITKFLSFRHFTYSRGGYSTLILTVEFQKFSLFNSILLFTNQPFPSPPCPLSFPGPLLTTIKYLTCVWKIKEVNWFLRQTFHILFLFDSNSISVEKVEMISTLGASCYYLAHCTRVTLSGQKKALHKTLCSPS